MAVLLSILGTDYSICPIANSTFINKIMKKKTEKIKVEEEWEEDVKKEK